MLWIPAGGLALFATVASIYLRGYLVPGTPELTQRYFPAWLVALFDTEPMDDEHHPGDTEKLLRSAGVVEECETEDDLCLTEDFSDVWWRRIRRFRDDRDRAASQLAAVVDVDPEGLEFDIIDDEFAVTYQGDQVAHWASAAGFYADLAVEPTLAEYISEFEALSDQQRTEMIGGMRVFLEKCPACDGGLSEIETVQESCCSDDVKRVTVECEVCGAELISGTYA